MLEVLLLIAGFAILVKSSDLFLEHSIAFSEIVGISRLFLSLFVISVSTSMPEFFVSLIAALKGQNVLSLSNIYGTVAVNISLGLCLPLILVPSIVWRKEVEEVVFMLLAGILSLMLLSDYSLSFLDAIALLFLFLLFYLVERRKERSKEVVKKEGSAVKELVFMLVFLVAMFLSSRIVVDSIVAVSRKLNLSIHFLAITVSAIGTSLPEIVTSFIAAFRREFTVSIGTIVGSNIIDMCLIVGAISLLKPLQASVEVLYDINVFLLISLLLLFLLLASNSTVTRIVSLAIILLNVLYFAYTSIGRLIALFIPVISSAVAGSFLVYFSSENIVEGCKSIERRSGISTALLGIFLIPIITTLPNIIVSLLAVARGIEEVILPSIVGNNILNITLSIPFAVFLGEKYVIRDRENTVRYLLLMLASTVVFCILSLDALISRLDAVILLVLSFLFFFSLKKHRKGRKETKEGICLSKAIVRILFYGLVLVVGCFLIEHSAEIAIKSLGLSENVVGLLLISLAVVIPEGFTAILASKKGLVDLSVGNIIGDCLGAIPLTAGIISIIKPLSVNTIMLHLYLPFLLYTSLIFALFILSNPLELTRRNKLDITTREAIFLFFIFLVYILISGSV